MFEDILRPVRTPQAVPASQGRLRAMAGQMAGQMAEAFGGIDEGRLIELMDAAYRLPEAERRELRDMVLELEERKGADAKV